MDAPKLRFKEFNDEWQKDFLNNNAVFLQGLTYKPNDVSNKGIIVLRSSNIQNSMIDYNDIVKVNIDISPKLRIRENDILICVRNGSKNLVGKTAWLSNNEEKCTWGAFMNVIRPLKKNKFIYYYLNSKYFYNYIWKDLGTATVNQITLKTLNDCKLFLPSEEEQEKIGIFLSLLDKKIELQSKKIEALKLYTKKQEKYILDKIKNDTSTFKCNIENICSIQTGKSNTQDKDENGIYPFYIRSEQIEHSNKYIFNCEAVLTIGDGNIGKVFFYTNGKFDCHQRVYVMNNFSNNILGKYFYYYFSNNFYKRAKLMSAKNTVDSVRQEMISKMNISIPPINKQKEIIKLFDILENKVNLEINKLSKLELLKKGLMQNMFI